MSNETDKLNWSITSTTWLPDEDFTRYYATLVQDTPMANLIKYGRMTREEAIAMAKLLDASQTY